MDIKVLRRLLETHTKNEGNHRILKREGWKVDPERSFGKITAYVHANYPSHIMYHNNDNWDVDHYKGRMYKEWVPSVTVDRYLQRFKQMHGK